MEMEEDNHWMKKLNGVNILIAIIVAVPMTWVVSSEIKVKPLTNRIVVLEKNNAELNAKLQIEQSSKNANFKPLQKDNRLYIEKNTRLREEVNLLKQKYEELYNNYKLLKKDYKISKNKASLLKEIQDIQVKKDRIDNGLVNDIIYTEYGSRNISNKTQIEDLKNMSKNYQERILDLQSKL